MINTFEKLLTAAKETKPASLAVASAEDPVVIQAVSKAREEGLADAILVGRKARLEELLKAEGMGSDAFQILDAETEVESAEKAVRLVHDGRASALMKGLLPTGVLMRAVLNKEWGLRGDTVLSHCMFYQTPALPRFLVVTDGGMCTFPTLEQKIAILENAAGLLKLFDYDCIYAAALCATEKPDPKIKDSMEAAELAAMTDHWSQWNMHVFGPVGVDLAISEEACRHKSYKAVGAGKADIILAPDYQAGNAFGKALTYFADADSAGIVLGAKAPVILVSRSDPARTKTLAIALSALAAAKKNKMD